MRIVSQAMRLACSIKSQQSDESGYNEEKGYNYFKLNYERKKLGGNKREC